MAALAADLLFVRLAGGAARFRVSTNNPGVI